MARSWEQLLGGYATNTLTEEEKRQLYEAALDDQALFDALTDEEALRALLADPSARQRVLDSLQASENTQPFVAPSSPRLRWYRQPSSLAWAGSLAAMGLALIFGWQMESLWGPVVREEVQSENFQTEDNTEENDEMAIQPQPSQRLSLKETPVQEVSPPTQQKVEGFASQPASIPDVKPPGTAPVVQGMEQRGQAQTEVSSGRPSTQMTPPPSPRARKMAPPMSESAMTQRDDTKKQSMGPSIGDSLPREKASQPLAQTPTVADPRRRGDVRSTQNARELFYANKSRLAADRVEEIVGSRTQQFLGGRSSRVEGELREDSFTLQDAPATTPDLSVDSPRGLRYHFVLETPGGTDQVIHPQQFSGDWEDLYLSVESNIPGYLYVLSEVGKRRWQSVNPQSLRMSQSAVGAIEVSSYQSVKFALNPLTNSIGKPIVSSLMVLLSSTPIPDLGTWLGMDRSQRQSEILVQDQGDQDVIVMDLTPQPEAPLVVNIPLPQ